jgi:MerR family transcriptional regulator, light-induced transcriptional regulator
LAPRRARAAPDPAIDHDELGEMLALIKRHDAPGFQQAMQQRLARKGLFSFVQDTVAPLTQRVGEAWEEGSFEVFEEHLFTELTKRLLRQAIGTLPAGSAAPRIVLTSVPDEPHVLGLLMVEALLALEGAQCIPLGTQMPLLEIVRAAGAHRADVVALSFSIAFPQRQIGGLLEQLRLMLPAEVELWAGGRGIVRQSPLPGTTLITSLDEAVAAVHDWRTAHA